MDTFIIFTASYSPTTLYSQEEKAPFLSRSLLFIAYKANISCSTVADMDITKITKDQAAQFLQTAASEGELGLDRWNIVTLPQWFMDVLTGSPEAPIQVSELEHLNYLNLSNNGLEILPPELSALKHLHRFNGARNKLKVFPKELCLAWQDLEDLSLECNQIERLPVEMGQMKSLKNIVLSENWLSQIPSELGDAPSLEYMEINNNRIDLSKTSSSILSKMEPMDYCFQFVPQEMLPVKGLFLGSVQSSFNREFLKEHNVTTILTVSDKIKPPFPDEFKYELIEIRDDDETNIKPAFRKGIKLIDLVLGNNEGILVHCAAGVSRSASVVIAYVMHKLKIPYEKALPVVRSHRPCVTPNSEFAIQLRELCKTLSTPEIVRNQPKQT